MASVGCGRSEMHPAINATWHPAPSPTGPLKPSSMAACIREASVRPIDQRARTASPMLHVPRVMRQDLRTVTCVP
jgi:hypothetical protein